MNEHFDPVGHVYTRGGVRVPSVTEILGGLGLLKDLSFLDPFYRERGQAVHAAIALEFAEDLDWSSLDDEVRPRVERFARFKAAAELRPLLVERPLFSNAFGYAGTLDYLGGYGRHPLAILDWKGDAPEPGHELQVGGGYRGLLVEAAIRGELDIDPAELMACPAFLVPLGGTSDLPSVRQVRDDGHHAMTVFRAAAAVYRWRLGTLGDPR